MKKNDTSSVLMQLKMHLCTLYTFNGDLAGKKIKQRPNIVNVKLPNDVKEKEMMKPEHHSSLHKTIDVSSFVFLCFWVLGANCIICVYCV